MANGPDMTKQQHCFLDSDCPAGDQCSQAGVCVTNNCSNQMCQQGQVCIGSLPCVPSKCFGVFCSGSTCSEVDGQCH